MKGMYKLCSNCNLRWERGRGVDKIGHLEAGVASETRRLRTFSSSPTRGTINRPN